MTERRRAIEKVTLSSGRWMRRVIVLGCVLPAITFLWWLNNRFLTPVYPRWWELSLLLTILVTPSVFMVAGRLWRSDRRWQRINRFVVGECENCGYDLSAFTPIDDEPKMIRCPECGHNVRIARPPNGVW